jgi:hypothetical protein
MNKLSWRTVLALLALFASFGAGCGKKTETTNPDTTGSSAQPPAATASKSTPATSAKPSGSQEVMAAIDRKDYDGAIAALLRIRQSVANAEQQVQFANLADEVRIKLIEAAPTQPKAAEALAVLRKITGGR